MTQPEFDLYSETFRNTSYRTFERMRQTAPIVKQLALDGVTPMWYVTRYKDVETLLKDKRLVRDETLAKDEAERYQASPVENLVNNHMLTKDGHDHRRLRNLVSKAFTPKRIAELEPRIETLANDLVDDVITNEEMDVIGAFSSQLPTIVILEMLGIPLKDRERLKSWSRVFIDLASMEAFLAAAHEFTTYLRNLFSTRRANPQDDLITALLQAEEAGDSLSEDELFSTLVLLIIAGHETTMNLIGNAVLALTQHPDQLEYLKQHPEAMPVAVEEFLRYDAPVERALFRMAAEDITYKGHRIKRGDAVSLILGSANRDEAQFEKADKLVLERSPNRHLSFGKGIHYCLGAPLARMEARIGLNTLVQRLPKLRLAVPVSELKWRNSPGFRGLEALPVAWDYHV